MAYLFGLPFGFYGIYLWLVRDTLMAKKDYLLAKNALFRALFLSSTRFREKRKITELNVKSVEYRYIKTTLLLVWDTLMAKKDYLLAKL